MSARHTPGPWHFYAGCITADPQEGRDRRPTIAQQISARHNLLESPAPLHVLELEAIANGQAMAAAPDLLKALEDLVAFLKGGPYEWHQLPAHHNRYQLIRAAMDAIDVAHGVER